MRFVYGKQDWATRERGQENVYLLTNGLGGFSSASMINSNTRNDHAFLMASLRAPNVRYNLVNRLEETLEIAGDFPEEPAAVERVRRVHLSSQEFADAARNENGYLYLNSFVYEDYPEWTFQAGGVEVVKRVAMAQGKNLTAVQYLMENRMDTDASLTVTPHLQFVPKGKPLTGEPEFMVKKRGGENGGEPAAYEITALGQRLYFRTDGDVRVFAQQFCEGAYYAYDACDGRESEGRTCVVCEIKKDIPAHTCVTLEMIYHTRCEFPDSAEQVINGAAEYRRSLREAAEGGYQGRRHGLHSPAALQLAVSANQFISERESTGGRTILAGYPFFEDWGRDTMIALEGCCMTTGQYGTAKSILRTFAAYCRKGLMPNLFPEGSAKPRYNTADAALLFINSVYMYVRRTGETEFAREMWPVMTQIIEAYRDGTDYGICMDADGLIRAGLAYDQVTWMDVRIGDYLPTPRHGKPVEINAYWYNALKIMEKLGAECTGSADGRAFGLLCGQLAEKVRESFREKFWIEEKGCLRDVLSGTKADEQFRCNQIWAVSMPFSMLNKKQERRIVDAVYEKLYTPLGLRTLGMDDAEFCGAYGGELRARDLAYHQGTVWVFPLGAYHLAYLKNRVYAADAVRTVKRQLEAMEGAMQEGCIGQLPEIYDGERPAFSRGCFAQAWSAGEILRAYEAVENGMNFAEA